MSDKRKTKQQLLDELIFLRQRLSDLEKMIHDEKNIRDRLSKSEQRYRQLVESTTDWIWETDTHHCCIYTNNHVKTMLGYDPEEILGKPPTLFMPPKDAEAVQPFLDQIVAEPRIFSGLESRQRHKDGSTRYLELNVIPVFTADGSLTGFRGITRDITARKKMEQDLREAEERFRLVSQAANDAVYDWNIASGTLWLSESHRKFLGFPEQDNHYGWWKSRLHPADRERILSGLRSILKGLSSSWMTEYQFLCADGRYISIVDRGQILRDEQGKPLRIVGAMMDVTSRKLAEEALASSEENYRLLIEDSPIAMMVYGKDSNVTMVNKRALDILGVEENVLLGKPVDNAQWKFFNENGRELLPSESPIQRVIASQKPLRDKIYGVSRPDTQEIKWYLINVQPQRNKFGQLLSFVSSFIDISENLRMQKAIAESEAKFRFLTEKMSDVVWTMNMNLTLTYASPSIEHILGYEREELLKQPLANIITPESLAVGMNLLEKELDRNRQDSSEPERTVIFDAAAIHRNSSLVWLENIVSFIRDHCGKVIGLYGVSRNITEFKQAAEEKEHLILELKQALSEVKTLSGLLPICSHCKKIRDDKGYWNQLEGYISEHSEALFSHSLCPECAVKLYPEFPKKKPSI